MLKTIDELFSSITKGMFLDYTKDFCNKFDGRPHNEINMMDLRDFIDAWVDEHFKDEGKDAGS